MGSLVISRRQPRRAPGPVVSGLAALLAATAFAGCTTTRNGGLQMDPLYVDVDREDLALSRLNDEELFACGSTAYQAKDYRKAARCFTRLADNFPKSKRYANAQYNAGIAYEAQAEYLLAVERYKTVMDPARGHGDALDATWRTASAYYHLADFPAAIELLEAVAARTDLESIDLIHANTHLGVCWVELGEIARAETRLRAALALYHERAELERLDDYFPCQAQFFLAEIYRLHFEGVKLQVVDDTAKLSDDLEYKAQLLLSAQGHYLRAIRMGNAHWAIAAGQRIGGLYEGLYDEMTHAPVPGSLDAEQAELYRSMLRKKVRVLVQKAISIYERTLTTAERIGVSSAFLEQTRASLDRMKQVLLADAAADDGTGAPDGTPPAESDPDRPPDARPTAQPEKAGSRSGQNSGPSSSAPVHASSPGPATTDA